MLLHGSTPSAPLTFGHSHSQMPLDAARMVRPRYAAMFSRIRLVVVQSVSLAGLWAGSLLADAWVERMLPEKEHDFGTVACGSEAVYRFAIRNTYKHDIELASVRSSCGCCDSHLEITLLRPGEVGYVVARLNTRSFSGSHEATLTLEAAWNDNGIARRGEATMHVRGCIRGKMLIEPDVVVFDRVRRGEAHERQLRISFDGRDNWRVSNVLCDCEDLEVQLAETMRTPDDIVYEMLIRLNRNAPPGFLHEQLVLVIDDRLKPPIPIQVLGRVVENVTVAPQALFFGKVGVGETVVKKVIVRGSEAFRIVSVQSERNCFEFATDEAMSTRHVVDVVLRPKHQLDLLRDRIRIVSDLKGGGTATVVAHAQVVPSHDRVPTQAE
jgi:Protein of unknown function (DUF1573)